MDPLSITAGCLALLSAVAKTTAGVTTFICAYRDARNDLTAVNRELSDLAIVLELLKSDGAITDDTPIPKSLQMQIVSIITNCTAVVTKINIVLKGYQENSKISSIKWVASGKGEIAGLRMSLEAHRVSLSLAVELRSISVSNAIKKDTSAIYDDVVEIQQATCQILKELEELRAIVSGAARAVNSPDQNYTLMQYLGSLTSYAETVWHDEGFESDRESLKPPTTVPGKVHRQAAEPSTPQVVSTSSVENITWYGQFKCNSGQGNDQAYFRERHELSEECYSGNWEEVIKLLKCRRDKNHEIWVNCWRIRPAGLMWNSPSGFTALHQAAWHGAPREVVQELLQLGAWRLARTLRRSDRSEALSTPYSIARDHGRAHLYDLLRPVIRRPIDTTVLSELQSHLHNLIRKAFREHHRVHLECFLLPELEVLTEFGLSGMWFPINPELPNPRNGLGVDINLGGDELQVVIHLGKTQSQMYRISRHGTWSVDEANTL